MKKSILKLLVSASMTVLVMASQFVGVSALEDKGVSDTSINGEYMLNNNVNTAQSSEVVFPTVEINHNSTEICTSVKNTMIITNTSDKDFVLSDYTMLYRYSIDSISTQNFECYFAGISSAYFPHFTDITDKINGECKYFSMGFAGCLINTGNNEIILKPGDILFIYFAFSSSDNSELNQRNDISYNSSDPIMFIKR